METIHRNIWISLTQPVVVEHLDVACCSSTPMRPRKKLAIGNGPSLQLRNVNCPVWSSRSFLDSDPRNGQERC